MLIRTRRSLSCVGFLWDDGAEWARARAAGLFRPVLHLCHEPELRPACLSLSEVSTWLCPTSRARCLRGVSPASVWL